MSLTRKILGNTAIQVTGRFLGTVLGILTVAVLTRHLGRDGYGQFTTATSFLQFFGILADFGLTLTLMRMISQPGADENRLVGSVFTLRLMSALVFFGGAGLLGLVFPYPPAVKLAIVVGSASFLLMSLTSVLTGVFQKHLATTRSALAEVAGRLALFVGVFWAARAGYGLLAAVAMLVLGNLVQFGLNLLFVRRLVPFRLVFDRAAWLAIVRESWPIGLSIAFNLVYLKGDVVVLSLFRSQSEVGLYGAAYKVLDVVTVVPMIFMGLVMPVLANAWQAGQKDVFARRINAAFEFMTMLAIPLAVGAWAIGGQLMTLVAGQDFFDSGLILAILMIGGSMVFWGGLFGHAIVSLGLQRKMIWAYAADAIISFALYFLLIPRFGYLAAAWVTVFSEAFIAVATAVAVLVKSRVRLSLSAPLRAALASALMFGVLMTLPSSLNVLLKLLAGIAVYFMAMMAFGGIRKESLALLRRPR